MSAGPEGDAAELGSTEDQAGDSRFRALLGEVAAAPVAGAGRGAGAAAEDEEDGLPPPGTVLGGEFEVVALLGSGAMGDVLLARDIRLGRRVAVKIARPVGRERAERVRLALREQIATARLSHPNIVAIYQSGEWRGRPFLVLELVRGESLAARLRERRLGLGELLDVAGQVLAGLAHAHARGIVHQDVKPGNIMVDDNGVVKLLDFGLAGLDAGRESVAEALGAERGRPSPRGGTPVYMAPEQWRGEAADAQTDVWLVGMILFEAVAGRLPFRDRAACLEEAAAPRLDAVAPGTPGALADVVARALAKRREDRFASAEELAAALAAVERAEAQAAAGEDEAGAVPYWTLRPFSEADARWFFGRRREVAELVRRVEEAALVVVTGPSGAGKSSLVRAGLGPALQQRWPTLAVVRLQPGRQGLTVLHRRLLEQGGRGAQARVPTVEALAEAPGMFGHLLRERAREAGRRFLVVVDQLEELWTLGDAAERRPFLTALMGAADDAEGPLRVVVTLRDDFLSALAGLRELRDELMRGVYVLARPDAAGLHEALEEPARRLGYRFEEGVADAVVEGLRGHPTPLPLLQAAAGRLWERRDRERRLLTREALESHAGVAGLLAQHADDVVARLGDPVDRRMARAILTMLVKEGPTGWASQPVPTGQVLVRCGDEERGARVLVALLEGGLVSREPAEALQDGTQLRLAHEALLTAWGTLGGWLRESPERQRAARWRRRLRWAGWGALAATAAVGAALAVAAARGPGEAEEGAGGGAEVAAPRVEGLGEMGLLMVGEGYELHVRHGNVYKVASGDGQRIQSWTELRELYRFADGSRLPAHKPVGALLLDARPIADLECVRRGLPCGGKGCAPGERREATEVTCAGGGDEDCDGLVDCADPDCACR